MNDMSDIRPEIVADWKREAAVHAAQWVESGMTIGLGSGSTAWFALQRIGERLSSGEINKIVGVPTSEAVEAEARRLKIPLCSRDDPPPIDMTIDGADEVDANLNLIKGGGGALLREKFVAQLSRREVIVIDATKVSDTLGRRHVLPIEVIAFGWQAQQRFLHDLGGPATLRMANDGQPFRTDQGNWILDAAFGPIENPHELARRLDEHAGIVCHGLFLNLTTDVVVADGTGIRHIKRP